MFRSNFVAGVVLFACLEASAMGCRGSIDSEVMAANNIGFAKVNFLKTTFVSMDAQQPEVSQFLATLFNVFNENLLLKRDFFNIDNLNSIFGERSYSWSEYSDVSISGGFSDSGASSIFLGRNQECIRSAYFSWRRFVGEDGQEQISAQVSLGINQVNPACASLSMDVVEKEFGVPGRVTEIYSTSSPPSHGRSVMLWPKTHKFGNTDIEYKMKNMDLDKEILVEVRGDGGILGLILVINTSKQ